MTKDITVKDVEKEIGVTRAVLLSWESVLGPFPRNTRGHRTFDPAWLSYLRQAKEKLAEGLDLWRVLEQLQRPGGQAAPSHSAFAPEW